MKTYRSQVNRPPLFATIFDKRLGNKVTEDLLAWLYSSYNFKLGASLEVAGPTYDYQSNNDSILRTTIE